MAARIVTDAEIAPDLSAAERLVLLEFIRLSDGSGGCAQKQEDEVLTSIALANHFMNRAS